MRFTSCESISAVANDVASMKSASPLRVGVYFENRSANAERLSDVERSELLIKLAKHGAVLLRGFDSDVNTFSSLVQAITPKTAIDPARSFFARNVQLVDSGTNEIGLHCENGTTPVVPNVVWFFCERQAVSGSQTTLCDGVAVWKLLSLEAKRLFLSNRVRFSRNVKHELWMKYVKHHFPHLSAVPEIKQEMLDDVFKAIDGSEARINADGSLFLAQSVFAAHSTFWGEVIAFANSLFTPSHNYEAPKICFENGESIPEWLLIEARSKSELMTTEIPWETGDIVLIDNTRVMHGRRKIRDPNRKLFTALGFLRDEDRALSSTAIAEVCL